MRKSDGFIGILASMAFCFASVAQAQSLNGSSATMIRQNQAAQNYGYTFLKTAQGVNEFVEAGYLVRVSENRDLEIHNVSYPYARPEVKMFVERLGNQYRNACGEKMTITSLTRPISRQPSNASSRSVHPTGMAVDLRVPYSGKCRSWLQSTLLSLEKTGVLDVTRERHPPHFHVAVFTKVYKNYVEQMEEQFRQYIVGRGETLSLIAYRTGSSVRELRQINGLNSDLIRVGQALRVPQPGGGGGTAVASLVTHQVRRGDTLWSIASRYGTSISSIRAENRLNGDMLQIGQTLRLSLGSSGR